MEGAARHWCTNALRLLYSLLQRLLLTYRYFRSVLYDDDGEQVEDDEDIIANGPHPCGDDDSFSSPLKRTRREYDSK